MSSIETTLAIDGNQLNHHIPTMCCVVFGYPVRQCDIYPGSTPGYSRATGRELFLACGIGPVQKRNRRSGGNLAWYTCRAMVELRGEMSAVLTTPSPRRGTKYGSSGLYDQANTIRATPSSLDDSWWECALLLSNRTRWCGFSHSDLTFPTISLLDGQTSLGNYHQYDVLTTGPPIDNWSSSTRVVSAFPAHDGVDVALCLYRRVSLYPFVFGHMRCES